MNTLLLLLVIVSVVDCYPAYKKQLPNADGIDGVAALGHESPSGGGDRNKFGIDFAKNSRTWTNICQLDSDDDGLTNGQELGDPCCEWTASNPTTLITEGLSHPGRKDDVSTNPVLVKPNCNDSEDKDPKDSKDKDDKKDKDDEEDKDGESSTNLTSLSFSMVLTAVLMGFL